MAIMFLESASPSPWNRWVKWISAGSPLLVVNAGIKKLTFYRNPAVSFVLIWTGRDDVNNGFLCTFSVSYFVTIS